MNSLGLPDNKELVVAVDTETGGPKGGLHVDDGARVSSVGVAWYNDQGDIECRAYPFDQGGWGKPGLTPSLLDVNPNLGLAEWTELMEWLSQQCLVFHNAKFDLLMLQAGLREWGGGVDLRAATMWDTMLAEWVLEPLLPKKLDDISERLWGIGKVDISALQKQYRKRYDLFPWADIEPYLLQDVRLTLRLWDDQMERLSGQDKLIEQIRMETQVMRDLVSMQQLGIGYNVDASLSEYVRGKAELSALDAALPFQPATPAKARKWFFDECQALPHCRSDKTGVESVQECCVRSLIAQRVEGATEWKARVKMAHDLGKYYEGFALATGVDGRLRSDWKQDGTITMRFSSKRVNLQALPHKDTPGLIPVRDLFQAADGYQLWEFDLAQAEARVAAKVAGCETWLAMFREGNRDLHAETSDELFGDHSFERRQVAKRANFSLIYGTGPATFRRMVDKFADIQLSDQEARRVVEEWNALYPEFKRIARKAEQVANLRGYVRLLDGRRRYFGPKDELHAAFNAVIQGSIGQFVKRWFMHEVALGTRVLLQTHDSLAMELPIDDVQWEQARIMQQGGAMASDFFGVPMLAESKHWETLNERVKT